MAGAGSRFTKAGYTRPKYEIEVLGRPLFDWSMLSLQAFSEAGWHFHFTARDVDAPTYIVGRCAALGISDYQVDLVVELTDGQATTAMSMAEAADPNAPFAIYNIDTYVAPGAMAPPLGDGLVGWIPCFPAPGDGWSFARCNESGRVVELREKKRISDHATVGLYWFASAASYVEAYRSYYSDEKNLEKGERYVAPLYNHLIDAGERVEIAELALSDVGMLGTPDQVSEFASKPPPSAAELSR